MKAVHVIAWILLVIGGINWLLIGVADLNVVEYLGSGIARVVYILVGLSAILSLFTHKRDCAACVSTSTPSNPTV